MINPSSPSTTRKKNKSFTMTSALLASLITLVLILTCILCYVYVGFVLFDANEVSSDGRSASSSSSSPSTSFKFRNVGQQENSTSGPIVSTTSGKVEGLYLEVLGKRIQVFYGIPYATPPIGSLRFARTNPVIKWRQTLRAVNQPPTCLQFKSPDIDLPWVGDERIEESEDCLKLNVWTPSSSISTNRTRPTIIWIHGGGFVSGHIRTKEFDGSVLAAQTDSIVAMMNYRVGVFGFLNLNHPEIDGNQGMYDQVQAIKWIVSNVRAFGGDPSSITLMGESAGGASVGYHMISPLTRDLFQRAIIQSGSPLMPNSLVSLDQIYAIASEVTSSLGCNKTSSPSPEADEADDLMVECLRSKPVEQLLKIQSRIIRRKDDTTFCPSFYDDFLPENPIDAMRNPESFGSVPKQVLMGFNKDEGSVFMYFSNPEKYPAIIPNSLTAKSAEPSNLNPKSVTSSKNNKRQKKVAASRSTRSSSPSTSSSQQSLTPKVTMNLTLPEVTSFATRFMKSQNPSTTRNLLSTLYAGVNESVPGSVFNATRTNVGEFFVICPALFAATEFVSANISVYFYHFVHRPRNTPWRRWVGAAHYEEVQFVFGLPLIKPDEYTKDEIKLSKKIMKSWTTFARTGTPSLSETTRWPQFKTATSSSTSSSSSSTLSTAAQSSRNKNNDHNKHNANNSNEVDDEEKYVEISSKNSWKIKSKVPQEKCSFWKLTYEVTHSQAEKPDGDYPSSSNNSDTRKPKDTNNSRTSKDDEKDEEEEGEEDGDEDENESSDIKHTEGANKKTESRNEKEIDKKKESSTNLDDNKKKMVDEKKENKNDQVARKVEEKKEEPEEEGDEDGDGYEE